MEEHFKAVKDRVLREQLQNIGKRKRRSTASKDLHQLKLEPRREEGLMRREGLMKREGPMRGEKLMEELTRRELEELGQESPTTKRKKSKRWFKKFGSRSMEYECDVSTLHTRAMGSPVALQEQDEHIPQPQETQKTKKRWSYRTLKKQDVKLKRCHSVSSTSKSRERE